jgi:outer membrane murein-binding lipoprotein Lpp
MAETWIEPTLRQLLELEENYETDFEVMQIAWQKAKISETYQGLPPTPAVMLHLLATPVSLAVNLGLGSTDPLLRLQNFHGAIRVIIEILQLEGSPLNIVEIIKEIFGYIGFKDGARFLLQGMGNDPEKMQLEEAVQQLQAMVAQLEEQINVKTTENEAKKEIEYIKQTAEDRRTAAQLKTQVALKEMDLLNPVVGEKPPARKKEAA